jgi:hypothetical protein
MEKSSLYSIFRDCKILFISLLKHFIYFQDWIKGNVSECGQSVFIFDEIDKMPVGVIDGLRSFMDFHEVVGGVDFRG